MSAPGYSLSDVRRSYDAEKSWAELQGDLVCWALYRPLSFYVSWALLRLGVPILAVTLSSAVVACSMLATAWFGGPGAWPLVLALGIAYPILDCADGNMARTTGSGSRLGGIVDGTVDLFYNGVVIVSLGLLTDHAGGGLFGDQAVTFSLLLVVLVLFHRAVRETYTAHFAGTTYFKPTRPERIPTGDLVLIAVVGWEHGYPWAIALGAATGTLDVVLLCIGVYTAAIFVGALVMTFLQAASADQAAADPGAADPAADEGASDDG